MTYLVRHTDVLGGYDHVVKGGGVVGGFLPYNKFLGWRTYSITATYVDPDGLEFPVIRIQKSSGPTTDTIAQVQARASPLFVDRPWPMDTTLLRGSYPGLAWWFLDPATLAYVAGPLLPIGNVALGDLKEDTRNKTPITDHVLQWFEHVLPTGPYIGVLVARDPSEAFPLWVSGHPVEIVTGLLDEKGEAYDADSADAVTASLGAELRHIMPVTSVDESPQDVIDRLSEAYGFSVRRSLVDGSVEFVHWRDKLGSIAGLPTIGIYDIREEGGPTFDLSDSTRLNRVRVNAAVITNWTPGIVMVPVVKRRKVLGIPVSGGKVVWVPRAIDLNSTEKPASGLNINSADVTFDYSSDGVTADADTYGVQEAEIELGGAPGFAATLSFPPTPGIVHPTNVEQFAAGIARKMFDAHARGRQMATVVAIRGTGADDALLGEAVVLDLDHLPNAQLGQSPTSQRGGARPFRVIERNDECPGPVLVMADEGTGVQYGTTPTLQMWVDPFAIDVLRVAVSDQATLTADGAQVEFQVRVFEMLDTVDTSDPGTSYTVFDSREWTDDPQIVRLGPFPPIHRVIVRVRAWLYGGAASDWSSWYDLGGPINPVSTSISNLLISGITDTTADLDWSYDESPAVGQVKVQFRDVTAGLVGAYSTFSTLAAGTETETLTGLTTGRAYQVRLVLIDGGAAEYGDVLTGTFATTGGKISSLAVSAITASSAKLTWTNTDASRQVLVEYRVSTTTEWQSFRLLNATSNRVTLNTLAPSVEYDVQVSLVSEGVSVGDGADGAALTATFTTLAVSAQLDPPLFAGVFWGVNQTTGAVEPGLYGIKLFAHPQNPMPHDLVIEEAVETAVGSGTPGAFAEVATVPAVSGNATYWTNTAPNDGLWRWLRALSRLTGYTDSVETESLPAKPWSASPQPPSGGGVPNILELESLALGTGANGTGFAAFADGAEIYRITSPNSKAFRVRLYKTEAGRTADLARPDTDHNWPTSLLLDARVTAAESYSVDLDSQRVRILLDTLPDLYVYWTLTNDEAGTEDIQCWLYYFASASGPLA